MTGLKIGLRYVTIFSLFFGLFLSCSLDYFSTERENSEFPEFVFKNADFDRIEDGELTVSLTGTMLEQYSNGEETFVQYPQFELYDGAGNVSVEGQCDLVSANTNTEVYSFYKNIALVSHEQNAKITAQNLRWLGKEEIFSSVKDDFVTIEVENTDDVSGKKTTLVVNGKDFSANGFDFNYSFAGPVEGEIIESN